MLWRDVIDDAQGITSCVDDPAAMLCDRRVCAFANEHRADHAD